MLSSGRGYFQSILLYIVAYVLPAGIIWGVIGTVLVPVREFPWLPFVAWTYALWFGICEAVGLPFRSLTSTWQVPAQWLQGHSNLAQTFLWGFYLGPGLVTRNPYAGIWLLPLLIPLIHNQFVSIALSVAIGVAHGATRALGVLWNWKSLGDSCSHELVLTQWRWRFIDGIAMLLVAGVLTAYTFSLFGFRF